MAASSSSSGGGATNYESQITSLKKLLESNALIRSKFVNEPLKWFASESEIDSILDELSTLSTQASDFAKLSNESIALLLDCIMSLLSHENDDLRIDSLSLLVEMTDPELYADEKTRKMNLRFIDAIMDMGCCKMLVDASESFDVFSKKDQVQVITLFENLCEIYDTASAEHLCEATNLLQRLMDWMGQFSTANNNADALNLSLEASELLSIILISPSELCFSLASPYMSQLLSLCETTWGSAHFKKKSLTLEEDEFCANVVDCISRMLLSEDPAQVAKAQAEFKKNHGFEICVKFTNYSVLTKIMKLIDYGCSNNVENVECFISVGGIRVLFPVLKECAKIHLEGEAASSIGNHKKIKLEKDFDCLKNIFNILASCFLLLDVDSTELERVCNKFDQPCCASLIQLLGILYRRYETTVLKEEEEEEEEESEPGEEENNIDEENYFKRLNLGLNSLQSLYVIIKSLLAFGKLSLDNIQKEFAAGKEGEYEIFSAHIKSTLIEMAYFENNEQVKKRIISLSG